MQRAYSALVNLIADLLMDGAFRTRVYKSDLTFHDLNDIVFTLDMIKCRDARSRLNWEINRREFTLALWPNIVCVGNGRWWAAVNGAHIEARPVDRFDPLMQITLAHLCRHMECREGIGRDYFQIAMCIKPKHLDDAFIEFAQSVLTAIKPSARTTRDAGDPTPDFSVQHVRSATILLRSGTVQMAFFANGKVMELRDGVTKYLGSYRDPSPELDRRLRSFVFAYLEPVPRDARRAVKVRRRLFGSPETDTTGPIDLTGHRGSDGSVPATPTGSDPEESDPEGSDPGTPTGTPSPKRPRRTVTLKSANSVSTE